MEIIAEIGQNHNGDLSTAIEMIYIAKECGADVAKFQLYDAVKLFPTMGNPWFEYNCKTEIKKDQLCKLFEECNKANIEFMASVFDNERIKWLEELGVKRYKIASRSIEDSELINALCLTGKPLIVSLGYWFEKEFPVFPAKAKIDYLYCISKYPTPLEDVLLSKVDFSKYSGFSDHTLGISASMAALARGARIVEKHFTLNKNSLGPDHSCSMNPAELTALAQFKNDLIKLI
jgi:sialic acid synthase SpsE